MQISAISRLTPLCGALALGAAALLPGTGLAQGTATGADRSSIDAQYQRDVQRCRAGQTSQDRTACLREAGAARDEARRGRLRDPQNSNFDQNAMNRCQRLPSAQQQDCLTQMRAPSRVIGTVEGGGVLRETVIPVPPGTPGAVTTTPGVGAPGATPMAPPATPPAPGVAPAPGGWAPTPAPATGPGMPPPPVVR